MSGKRTGTFRSKFHIDLTWNHVACLRPSEWLNDEVINFYFELLQERCERKNIKCYFLNTFFTVKFNHGYSYESVRDWSSKANVKVIEMDKVFIPVHAFNHWCLAVINFKDKRFEYYDSLGGSNDTLLQKLRMYVVDEARTHNHQNQYSLVDWEDHTPQDTPRQDNLEDCGVFTCKFADYLSDNLDLQFSEKHMPYFRTRMALELDRLEID